jgi:hypothetical protein
MRKNSKMKRSDPAEKKKAPGGGPGLSDHAAAMGRGRYSRRLGSTHVQAIRSAELSGGKVHALSEPPKARLNKQQLARRNANQSARSCPNRANDRSQSRPVI